MRILIVGLFLYQLVSSHDDFGPCHFSDDCMGVLKIIRNCHYAINLLRRGIQPEVHGFDGFDAIVCCPSPLNYPVVPYGPYRPHQYPPHESKFPNVPHKDNPGSYKPFGHHQHLPHDPKFPNVPGGDVPDTNSYRPHKPYVSHRPYTPSIPSDKKDENPYKPSIPTVPTVQTVQNIPKGDTDSDRPTIRPFVSDDANDRSNKTIEGSIDPDRPDDKINGDVLSPTNVTSEAGTREKPGNNNKEDDKGNEDTRDVFAQLLAQLEAESKAKKSRDKPGDVSKQQCADYYSYTEIFVFNGNRSLPKEFPHMAVIGYDTDDSISWGCGGALISENFILTAAHCLFSPSSGSAKHVRLGDLDLESTTDDAEPQQFRVKRTIAHPDYNPPFKYHDIGLIEIDGKVNRTDYVNIACLDITRQNGSINLTTIGFGKTDFAAQQSSFLMKADLLVFPRDTCQRSYRNDLDTLNNGINDEIMICAGGESDTCQGDSGGPLFYKNEDVRKSVPVYNIVGVTSFGKACGVSRIPGVYTRVHNYLRWIEDIVWPK